MEIERTEYLNKLKNYEKDGQIKVITGIRRCGKSYLLKEIFRNYLVQKGVNEKNILVFSLDLADDIQYRTPLVLAKTVRNIVSQSTEQFYVFIDEIQMSDIIENPYNPSGKKITFYDALNDMNSLKNVDVYVTGSNSKMLSSDVLTEFRGRADEIRVHPLSFAEFYSAVGGESRFAFEEYLMYGGMPFVLSEKTDVEKTEYLKSLFKEVYLKDIVERKKIEREDVLSMILDFLSSSIGSLTNTKKINDSLISNGIKVSQGTTSSYVSYLLDAFLFSESKRYDVKGKKYFDYPSKFYCEDVGLRNARLGFRQQEATHLMENILYNELILRGYSVDVGVVPDRENKLGKRGSVNREIDFVATLGGKKVYIQSAYALETEEKRNRELAPLMMTGDSFKKVIVRNDVGKSWFNEQGILNINLIDFLLDKKCLD